MSFAIFATLPQPALPIRFFLQLSPSSTYPDALHCRLSINTGRQDRRQHYRRKDLLIYDNAASRHQLILDRLCQLDPHHNIEVVDGRVAFLFAWERTPGHRKLNICTCKHIRGSNSVNCERCLNY